MAAHLLFDHMVTGEGEPDYGHIVRYWRKHVLQWKSPQIIVDLYNEQARQVREPEISMRWWQRMEQFNQVPIDQRRRRLIQVLLSIPPAYLGLATLAPLDSPGEPEVLSVSSGQKTPLDIQVYQEQLKTFWRSRETKKPPIFLDLVSHVAALEHTVLYGRASQRPQALHLLCDYLLAAGNAHRYQGHMESALNYLSKAVTIAQENQYQDLLVKAFYVRGFTHFNRWTNWPDQKREIDLSSAVEDFSSAYTTMQQFGGPVSPALRAAILADGGRARAYYAQDRQDTLAALHMIDQAGTLVSARSFANDPHFLRVDQEWYHIDKAEALIAGGMPGLALDELDNVYNKGDPQARQRYFYVIIIEAEAHFAKGWGDICAIYLEEALGSLNKTNSRRHLAHIAHLHETLQEDSHFRSCPDVARLGAHLLRFQHPEVF